MLLVTIRHRKSIAMIKKINYSTALGMILSLFLIVFIILFAANEPRSFINPTGLVIVIMGCLAAVFLSYPLRDVKRSIISVKSVLFYESLNPQKDADEVIEVAKMWFRRDTLAIENAIETINNPYLKTGFQLIIDKTPVEDILALLKWRISRVKAKEKAEADIFRTMAQFAPAFGMLGTLVGLINMLQALDTHDISLISFNMAVALITTFYGLLFANLLFSPISLKLERRMEHRVMIMSMVLEGIVLISERRTPAYIRETLNSFIVHHENELQMPESDQRLGLDS